MDAETVAIRFAPSFVQINRRAAVAAGLVAIIFILRWLLGAGDSPMAAWSPYVALTLAAAAGGCALNVRMSGRGPVLAIAGDQIRYRQSIVIERSYPLDAVREAHVEGRMLRLLDERGHPLLRVPLAKLAREDIPAFQEAISDAGEDAHA